MKPSSKKIINGKAYYSYKGRCKCGKQIATSSKRCRTCQGVRRSKLNDIKYNRRLMS